MTDIANIQNLAPAADVVQNVELENLYADNATIGTSFEAITNTNANQIIPPILGEDIDIVSASTADTIAGTGARQVKIWYLDANFNIGTQVVNLSGQTPVELSEQNITYILKAEIVATGTGLKSAGAITIAAVTAGAVFGVIDAGSDNMGNCAYMVPAGHAGYVHGFWADIEAVSTGVGTAEIVFQIAKFGVSGVANSEAWRTVARVSIVENDSDVVSATGGNANSPGYFEFPGGPIKLPAKCQVRLAGKARSGAVAAVAGFNIVIQGSDAGTVSTLN